MKQGKYATSCHRKGISRLVHRLSMYMFRTQISLSHPNGKTLHGEDITLLNYLHGWLYFTRNGVSLMNLAWSSVDHHRNMSLVVGYTSFNGCNQKMMFTFKEESLQYPLRLPTKPELKIIVGKSCHLSIVFCRRFGCLHIDWIKPASIWQSLEPLGKSKEPKIPKVFFTAPNTKSLGDLF